ncbi:MAG TPA: DUF6185 family protein [Pyrinomonadaceae bacterium]|nr:DUF6185 family protein [Pyrinomonadaceae bacterium]
MAQHPQNNELTTRKRRNARIGLTLAILILLAGLLFLAFSYRSNPTLAVLWPTTEAGLKLSFSPDLNTANEPIIAITGSANRFCQVELYLNGKLIGRTTTFDRESWSSGARSIQRNQFQFDQVMLHPGQNYLQVKGKLVSGVSGPREDAEAQQTVEWRPAGDVKPALYRVPKKITTQPLRVVGAALPRSSVVLSLFPEKIPSQEPYQKAAPDVVVTADDEGRFEGDVSFPTAGNYFVHAHHSVDDAPSSYIPGGSEIRFAPNSSSRVRVSVNYDQINVDVEENLPKDDPAAVDLLSGHKSLAKFISDEFDLRINDEHVAFEFRSVVPQLSINDNQVTVRASASFRRSSVFPVRSGRLEIARRYQREYPVQGPNDSLEVVINDYSIQAYTPVPTSAQYPSAVWTGARDPIDSNRNVQVSISFEPTKNPRNLLRFLTLSPYELFSYQFSPVFLFLICFLSAVPILWLLSLLEKHDLTPLVDEDYIKRLKRVGRFMLGLILLPGIQQAAEVLSYLAVERWNIKPGMALLGGSSSDRAVLLLAGTLVVSLTIVIVLTLLKLIFRPPSIRLWLRELRVGVVVAMLTQTLLAEFYIAVLLITKDLPDSFIPATIVTFIFLALIALSVRRLASQGPPGPISFKYLVVAVILLLLLAYPANRNIYSFDRAEFSTWEVTRTSLNFFFGMVQDFVPYVLLVGILRILHAADSRQDEIHPIIFAIPLLMFSCYVIGTTSNWFLVPIPFLLALKLYPALLALPPERVRLLNGLKPLAIEHRRWFLNNILELSQSERLLSSTKDMEKEIATGDLTIDNFLQRRVELENYAVRVRQKNPLPYGLEARDALSLGPNPTNWLNGLHAVTRGVILSLPFIALYLLTFLIKQIRLDSPFIFLWTSLRIITFVLEWAVYAFFFGYFFNQLQGESGLKKGLKVAAVVICCLSPVWLMSGVSSVELSATFLRAGQIFLFFTLLGVWAFDYHTFRITLGEQFTWKRFAQFGDMPSFTAVASVLLTSAGVAFSSVLSGRFLELVTQLVSAIFPEAQGATPK